MQLHPVVTEDEATDAPAIVDLGQRDRLHALAVVDAQRLHRPAGDREIAVAVDPLELRGVAQPVVARDAVAAQEGAVGRQAQRPARAPFGRELVARDAVDITACRPAGVAEVDGVEVVRAAAVGEEAGDAEGAVRRQLLVADLRHRQHAGVDVRRHRQAAIGAEAPVIGQAELEAVHAAVLEARAEEAGRVAAAAADRMREAGKRHRRQPEQVDARAVVIDALAIRPVGDADGGDLPGRLLGAAVAVRDPAGGVGGAVERHRAVGGAGAALRGEAAAAIEHHQHVLDDAVAQ